MGEALAVVATTLFSAANVSISKRYKGRVSSGGAFLSIAITLALSFTVWLALGLNSGFEPVASSALAWFALAGILTALVGRVFLFASLRHLGAVRGAAIKRLNPLFSVVLGVVLLGEVVSGLMAVGIVLIAASFAVLVRQSLRDDQPRDADEAPAGAIVRMINLGYLHGPVSALAYALGYVARKQGLLVTPDAVLGTMIGALSGLVCFAALAMRLDGMRSDLRKTFSEFNPWLWLAGLFTSLGQLLFFAALEHSAVSKIALIASMEVFVTMLISRLVLRRETTLTPELWLAAGLGATGTWLVILY